MIDLFPTLRSLVESEGLNPDKLSVALEADARGNIRVQDKHSVPFIEGQKMVRWQVPTLADLFRDSQTPPTPMISAATPGSISQLTT